MIKQSGRLLPLVINVDEHDIAIVVELTLKIDNAMEAALIAAGMTKQEMTNILAQEMTVAIDRGGC